LVKNAAGLIILIKATYIIDDKLGGVSSLNLNLIKHAPADFFQTVISISEIDTPIAKADIKYPVEQQIEFVIDNNHSAYTLSRNLKALIPNEAGALILNYGTEMAMLDHHKVEQTTFQLVHDEYNVQLAKEYGHIVDVFICHNAYIESKLVQMYPARKNDIFFLSHGVEIPNFTRTNIGVNAPLRLLFLGRFSKSKGIFDLPKIAEKLRLKNVPIIWTCIGAGPEEMDFKSCWNQLDKVEFLSPKTNEEVIQIASKHDVFVLPTKFEGTPVSLLETMSVGLVPVITSLNGGIQEIVTQDIGFSLPIDDNESFANAIETLHHNREKLELMSESCRHKIINKFNLENTSKSYFSLFSNYSTFKKDKKLKHKKLGSILDQPFLPDFITRFIRKVK
jgi:glycosyltransferase involved in cell wall biosynthesis